MPYKSSFYHYYYHYLLSKAKEYAVCFAGHMLRNSSQQKGFRAATNLVDCKQKRNGQKPFTTHMLTTVWLWLLQWDHRRPQHILNERSSADSQ